MRRLDAPFVLGVLVVFLSAMFAVNAIPAFAHGTCALHNPRPLLSDGFEQGQSEMDCTKGHHEMHLTAKLQYRYPGATQWITLDTTANVNVDAMKIVAPTFSPQCSYEPGTGTWQYHVRVTKAYAVNQLGQVVHQLAPPIRDSAIAYVTDINCTGVPYGG